MSENLHGVPEEEPSPTVARDRVLFEMAKTAWVKNSGDVQSLVGWFCQVTVQPGELRELASVFGESIAEAELEDPAALVGFYVIQEDGAQKVTIWEHDTQELADKRFDTFNDIYGLLGIDGRDDEF